MRKAKSHSQLGEILEKNSLDYIERTADKDLLSAIKRQEYCHVFGPPQIGKTHMLSHTQNSLKKEGMKVGGLDLKLFNGEQDSDGFFDAVILQIQQSLGIEMDAERWIETQKKESGPNRLKAFIDQIDKEHVSEGGAILIDSIETILPLPFSDDFFRVFHSVYHDKRKNDSPKRLSTVLFGIASSHDLIQNTDHDPIHFGNPIAIKDFECTPALLKQSEKIFGKQTEPLIQRIFYWTRGQPFLVQMLINVALELPEKDRVPKRLDEQVNRLFLQDRINEDSHLSDFQDYLLSHFSKDRNALRIYRKILKGLRHKYQETSSAHNRLLLSGLVRVEEENFVVRNKIYEQSFSLIWVNRFLEERKFIWILGEYQKDHKAEICDKCGTTLSKTCPLCERKYSKEEKECSHCGVKLASCRNATEILEHIQKEKESEEEDGRKEKDNETGSEDPIVMVLNENEAVHTHTEEKKFQQKYLKLAWVTVILLGFVILGQYILNTRSRNNVFENIRNQAEKKWVEVEELSSGQGIEMRKRSILERLESAKQSVDNHQYKEALKHYLTSFSEMNQAQIHDIAREESKNVRKTAYLSRQRAQELDAQSHALEEWQAATSALNLGEEEFESSNFKEAIQQWSNSFLLFEKASTKTELTIGKIQGNPNTSKKPFHQGAILASTKDHALKFNQNWSLSYLDMEFVFIEAGEFIMGSENGDEEENPPHNVVISQPFWMAKNEVTIGNYLSFLNRSGNMSGIDLQAEHCPIVKTNNRFEIRKGNDRFAEDFNQPMIEITWNGALDFCGWLSVREKAKNRIIAGYEYRLPTEAEWEYACRAGTQENYAGEFDQMSWFSSNSRSRTQAVGKKKANNWGLFDMHGNVWEWCHDWQGDYPSDFVTDPRGPEKGLSRILRGGSWLSVDWECRSSFRHWRAPTYSSEFIGFRVVLAPILKENKK